MNIKNITNPRYSASGGIFLTIDIVGVCDGAEFHATQNDPEPYGRDLYERAINLEFGEKQNKHHLGLMNLWGNQKVASYNGGLLRELLSNKGVTEVDGWDGGFTYDLPVVDYKGCYTVRDTSAVVKIADSYKASTNFIVYKNEDGTDNILISMIGESKIDKLNVSLKKHTNSSIDEKKLSITADEDNRFMIDAENVDNVSSIDIYNTDNNRLIGTVEFSNEQQPSLYGHSISLKNNGLIAVNSYWKMTDDFVKNSGAYVVMSINSSVSNALSKNDKKIYVKDAVNKNGYINFIYDLAPAQIGQTVTTDLFSSNGKLISSSSYSIKDYCYDYLDAYKAGENETEKNLVISLLNYGAYAQKYFKYETTDFVNENLTDNEKNVPEIQNSKAFIEQYGKNSIVNSNGIEYIGTSLLLESGCVIRHYFKIDDSKAGNISCYVNEGTSSERKLDLKKKGTYYYVDIDSIPAYSLKKDFKVTIYNGKDSSKKTIIDYSVYNYIAKALSKKDNSTLSELMKSLYWYGQYAN